MLHERQYIGALFFEIHSKKLSDFTNSFFFRRLKLVTLPTCSNKKGRVMNSNAPSGKEIFSRTEIGGPPLLPGLAGLQANQQETLGTYLDGLFRGQRPPISCTIPVVDQYLYPLQLKIRSVDGEGMRGFWRTTFCNQCAGGITTHPCLNTNTQIDCEMFCAGSSLYDGSPDDEPDDTLDLTRQSLCYTNSRSQLITCGILSITLYHQQLSDRNVLVSVVLSIGCDQASKHDFVIQRHEGLDFSLR